MLYPNPYLVVTPKGYSKHYYAGSERVAKNVGACGLPEETIIGVNEELRGMADELLGNVLKEQI